MQRAGKHQYHDLISPVHSIYFKILHFNMGPHILWTYNGYPFHRYLDELTQFIRLQSGTAVNVFSEITPPATAWSVSVILYMLHTNRATEPCISSWCTASKSNHFTHILFFVLTILPFAINVKVVLVRTLQTYKSNVLYVIVIKLFVYIRLD